MVNDILVQILFFVFEEKFFLMSLESVSRLSLVLVSVAFSAGKNGVPSVPFQVAGLGAARSA